jgi:hypothetical protein
VLLLGDPNHRQHLSQDTLNLFEAYPVAEPADAFVLRTSFRFDAEGARAYNAALIPREPGQAIQPLVCGFGSRAPVTRATARCLKRLFLITGGTKLGALEEG